MNEKNKQQQPQQGNKKDKDMSQQGQKPGSQDKDMNQQHGKQDRQRVQGEVNQPNQPDKRTEIDDNPGETKKKIPNMENDR